jgi:hypothetical protein
MALVAHFDVKNMSAEKYAEVLRRLEKAGAGAPAGRLHHTCYGPREALKVVDVFDTPQNFEAFGKTLVPILMALGIDPGQPQVTEVHNIIRGS